jgi:hypothetical protein
MSPEIGVGVLAALSEGQRAIAHLVVLIALAVIAALVFLMRRMRRPDQTAERQTLGDEQR